ncbi:MAG TPA: hypothetical protein ENO14_00080 [Chromatiales bacterium]|nr:hypothetical protein [Chromatiales bacterium]
MLRPPRSRGKVIDDRFRVLQGQLRQGTDSCTLCCARRMLQEHTPDVGHCRIGRRTNRDQQVERFDHYALLIRRQQRNQPPAHLVRDCRAPPRFVRKAAIPGVLQDAVLCLRHSRSYRVRRTLAISCEPVPAPTLPRGHEAAPPSTPILQPKPGAAERLVSFIALFDDADAPTQRAVRLSLATPRLFVMPLVPAHAKRQFGLLECRFHGRVPSVAALIWVRSSPLENVALRSVFQNGEAQLNHA